MCEAILSKLDELLYKQVLLYGIAFMVLPRILSLGEKVKKVMVGVGPVGTAHNLSIGSLGACSPEI